MAISICLKLYRICIIVYRICLMIYRICLMAYHICMIVYRICLMDYRICIIVYHICLMVYCFCMVIYHICLKFAPVFVIKSTLIFINQSILLILIINYQIKMNCYMNFKSGFYCPNRAFFYQNEKKNDEICMFLQKN